MIGDLKIVIVLPAYNAEKTIEKTIHEIDRNLVDDIILVDDASRDNTVKLAKKLGLKTLVHPENRGYGGNQKTCYQAALDTGADIIIMLHPDYQYTPKLIPAIAHLIASGFYDVILASRILVRGALKGGMPIYKYFSNRVLTLIENILLRQKLSEYHTGYRAFRKEVLEQLPLLENSDNFVFDNQMIAQIVYYDFRIGELSCPTRYAKDSSSISFRRSVQYGFGVLSTAICYRLQKMGLFRFSIFNQDGRKLTPHGKSPR